MKWSGGINDSIYGKGMLVDNEAVLFCMEALEALWKATGDDKWRRAAYLAAQHNASWIVQWDVPLPPGPPCNAMGSGPRGWRLRHMRSWVLCTPFCPTRLAHLSGGRPEGARPSARRHSRALLLGLQPNSRSLGGRLGLCRPGA